MNEALALRLLRKIMNWDEETATREYRWVRLMSQLKYDGYRDYVAGVRFPESLAGWLNQFDDEDRAAAYDFVKHRLVYYCPPEIHSLAAQFHPRFIEPKLRKTASQLTGVKPYLVMSDTAASRELKRARRRTLFIGLSDGARIDIFRRANAGVLVNDQIVLATHIDEDKWRDLSEELAKDDLFKSDNGPKFDRICLLDDFTGSGTSFIRQKGDRWTGKLRRFGKALATARKAAPDAFPVDEDFTLHIHHYISSYQARSTIEERLIAASKDLDGQDGWFSKIELSEGILLPESTKVTAQQDPDMWRICHRYYDHGLYEMLKKHLDEAKQADIRHGYGDSALPVVLEHNCPNNAITLLWAETEAELGMHSMRPLFPRRHRHS